MYPLFTSNKTVHTYLVSHQGSYHHGDLKNALIDAGTTQLNEKGLEGLSLRMVAKRAGVSHTAPYRHFKDKSHLMAAIAIQGYENLSEKIRRIIERYPHDLNEALLRVSMAYLELATENPRKTQLMFCPHNLDEDYLAALKIAAERPKGQIFELLADIDSKNFMLRGISLWTSLHGMTSMMALGFIEVDKTSPNFLRDLSKDLIRF